MADLQDMHQDDAVGRSGTLKHAANLIGAAISLALLVGAGVWGYKLVMRDVSGVPVIQAAKGPMRIQPDDPGGRQALYQGLSVNNVAAEGVASAPADRLILAPEPLDLTLEDTRRSTAGREESGPQGETQASNSGDAMPETPETLHQASIEAFAESLGAETPPMEDLPAADTEETAAQEDGLGRSLRPKPRPANLSTSPGAVTAASAQGVQDIDPATIAPGTRLAQLGAFASRGIAVKEWDKLSDRFDEYLQDKDRVIQKAESGGRTFYRLRALGFDDLSDARRFCSALVAERAECIPVVAR